MNILMFGKGRFSHVMEQVFGNNIKYVIGRTEKRPESFDDIDIIIPAITLSAFPHRFEKIRPHLKNQLILDVGSVKLFPQKIFGTYNNVMHTHPMFGPDSIKTNGGFNNLPRVICEHPDNEQTERVKNIIEKLNFRKIDMSCDEHDRIASRSQGLTHIVGRMLGEFGMKMSDIDTYGTKLLYQIMDQTCNDSWQLFYDLQNLNPYTEQMRIDIDIAFHKVFDELKKT